MDMLSEGMVLTFKKPHPCGSLEWEVVRLDAHVRLRCLGCGHQMTTNRPRLQKMVSKKNK